MAGITPATTLGGTIEGGIYPVGEKLVLAVSRKTQIGVETEYNYDFLVDDNYICTSLNVNKTVASVLGDSLLTVGLYRVRPGSDLVATEYLVAQCAFKAVDGVGGELGRQSSAGHQSTTSVVIGSPSAYNTATTSMAQSADSGDPAIALIANEPGTGPSQCRIRLKIYANPVDHSQGDPGSGNFNPSCLIVAEFARIGTLGSLTVNGVSPKENAMNGEEVLFRRV